MPETPLNWNLNNIALPPNAASQLVVDEVWGDSQMGMNNIRLAGAWPIADLPFVGRLFGILNTVSTGVRVTQPDNSGSYGIVNQTGGDAAEYLRPGDAWDSDGNSSDHFNFSVGWRFDTTGNTLRQLLVFSAEEASLYTGSYPLANQRLVARVFYRKTASCVPSIRVYPHRNGNRGGFSLVNLDNTGGVGYFDRSLNAANPSSGAEPAGFEIWTDDVGGYNAGDTLEILGVLLYLSDADADIVSTGYVHVPIYRSGFDASELSSNVSDVALNALHQAINDMRGGTACVDLVQVETGHNNDPNGYVTGITSLITKVSNSLSGGGYDAPDHCCWAMWSYDGNQDRMRTQADDLYAHCNANGYGFINLFKTYNGDDPETNGATFDGSPAVYSMDASNLHPSDTATADLIMQDIEQHWQPANWITGSPANIEVDQATDDGSISQGNIALGSVATIDLTIRNNAEAPANALTLGTLTASPGGSLTTDPSGQVIEAGSSVTATVSIDTVTEGARAIVVQIPSDDPDNPVYTITINASVIGPKMTIGVGGDLVASGDDIALAGLVVGEGYVLTLDITNSGMSDLTLGTVMVGGRLMIAAGGDPSGEVLAPAESTSVEIEVDTDAVGPVSGSVSVPSDDSNSPWIATLSGNVEASTGPSDGYTGPNTRQEYLNVQEADAIISEMLIEAHPIRQAWASLSAADKLACIGNASIDIDYVPWMGTKFQHDQPTAWPRKDRSEELILPNGEVQYPASLGSGEWSFASLPREIRVGVAIQAAARAADQLQIDQSLRVLGLASQGITGIGGAGTSWTTDGAIARQPSSHLHPDVRRLVSRYIPSSMEIV